MKRRAFALIALLAATACSGRDITPPTEPPPRPPVASVTVSPGTPSIFLGDSVQLSATTKDAQGKTLSSRAITWSSSAEAVATVNATGLVTGVSAGGPVTITATTEEQLGTAQVVVTARPPPTVAPFLLTLSSSTLSIVQGTATPTTTVNVVRNDFAGPVTLELQRDWSEGDHDHHGELPPGVTAAFTPNPATGNSAVLTLTVGAAVTPGVYYLYVFATGGFCCIPLTLTVTAASP